MTIKLTLQEHAGLRRHVAPIVLGMIADLERLGLAQDASEYLSAWRELAVCWVLFPQNIVDRLKVYPRDVLVHAYHIQCTHEISRFMFNVGEVMSVLVLRIVMDVRPDFRAWFEQECAALEKKYPPQ